MIQLKYCPNCGKKQLHWDGEKSWSCPNCDFILFHNVAAAVAVLVICDDEILFTRRNQEPQKGKLDLPGGFADPKESAETTCKRELWEELKLNINPSKLIYRASLPNTYPYKNILYNTLDLFFEYHVEKKFDVSLAEDEVSEIVWINKTDIVTEDLAFDSQKTFFSTFLKI